MPISVNYKKYLVSNSKKFKLNSISPKEVQGFEKEIAKQQIEQNIQQIDLLQEKLYAESKQSLLLVVQAMDAAGKDSTIKELTCGLNPQGIHVHSFKAPSNEEKAHDFLWRVHNEVPAKGRIGIFNRSHYEDVLIVKVHGWQKESVIEKRYGQINDFERMLSENQTKIIKIMLHISPEYQLEQFKERVSDKTKNWKFNVADLEERKLWKKYMRAFEVMLNKCSTKDCPWYVVPAEKKWFRTLVISTILLDALRAMKPEFPKKVFDLKAIVLK